MKVVLSPRLHCYPTRLTLGNPAKISFSVFVLTRQCSQLNVSTPGSGCSKVYVCSYFYIITICNTRPILFCLIYCVVALQFVLGMSNAWPRWNESYESNSSMLGGVGFYCTNKIWVYAQNNQVLRFNTLS